MSTDTRPVSVTDTDVSYELAENQAVGKLLLPALVHALLLHSGWYLCKIRTDTPLGVYYG